MTRLPQDNWPLEKQRERHRRRWWKYVCKEDDYTPSIFLDVLVTPESAFKIYKASVGWAKWKPGDFICEEEYAWDRLSGYFRVYQDPDGRIHTDSGLAQGIRYYGVRSATRHNFEIRQHAGKRKGREVVSERRVTEQRLQAAIKQSMAQKQYEEALEATKKASAEREFRRRTKTTSKDAKSSTALFFKLSAGAASIQ